MKFFSIVIPVFNAETFIGLTIRSLVESDFSSENFEVIFVDDGSTDKTIETIENYLATSDVTLACSILRNLGKSGPGIARNIGISRAIGEWVLFLDSDDQLTASALSELAEYIDQRKIKFNDDLVFFDGIKINQQETNESRICKHTIFSEQNDYVKNVTKEITSILRLNFDEHVIFCAFKRDFIQKSKLVFGPGIYEDVLFISQSLIQSEVSSHLSRILYKKTSRPEQITGRFTMDHAERYLQARKSIWDWLESDSNWFRDDFIADYQYGVRGAMGILFRRSSIEIQPQDRDLFDSKLTRFAVELFEDFEEMIDGPQVTELDLKAYSRYKQLLDLGLV
jgi:glycosyltransferase involved in cell wall biosynthesis